MADVVYIHPFPYGEPAADARPVVGLPTYPVLPVGVVALANVLKGAGHSVRGVNCAVERLVDHTWTLGAWLAAAGEPGLVLIDLHWYEHALGALEAAAEARAQWPRARIVLGGLTASRFAAEILDACPAVDGVLRGDAEGPILGLAAGEADVANYVTRDRRDPPRWSTPAALFADLDYADTSFLDHADAYRTLLYSMPRRGSNPALKRFRGQWLANGRGCAFNCSYCGGGRDSHEQLSGLRGILKRTPEAIADDLARLAADGVDQVSMTLDMDMFGGTHRDATFAAIADRDVRMGYYLESFKLPSTALLDALVAHGDIEHTELALSPLSGNTAVRSANGKRFDSEAFRGVMAAIAERDLSAFVFFSLNLPGEDDQTMDETLQLAEWLLENTPSDRVRMMNICHTLDPASPAAEAPGSHGLDITLRTFGDYLDYGRRLRSGEPWRFAEGERGIHVHGRDLPAMVARWDALAAQAPERVYAVPRF